MASTDRASLFVCAVGAQGWVTARSSVSRQDSTAPAVLLRGAVHAQGTYIPLMCNKYTSSLLFHRNSYIILRCNILWLPLVPSNGFQTHLTVGYEHFPFSSYSHIILRAILDLVFLGVTFISLKKSHLSSCSCELLKPWSSLIDQCYFTCCKRQLHGALRPFHTYWYKSWHRGLCQGFAQVKHAKSKHTSSQEIWPSLPSPGWAA